MKKKIELDVVRAVSCIMILVYHISGYINGYINHGIMSWTNIGVQVFFFLSGILAAYNDDYTSGWIKKKLSRILIPYWIYLIIILPIIALIDAGKISVFKVTLAFTGLMGFFWNNRIEPIGVLWFVSYILLCYVLTPFFNVIYKNVADKKLGEIYLSYISITFIMQIVTIPLALLIQFKSAWIACYLLGFFIQKRSLVYVTKERKKEQDITKSIIYIIACIGIVYRIFSNRYLDNSLVGVKDSINALAIQYFTCMQGAALFYIIVEICKKLKLNLNEKQLCNNKIVDFICKYSYTIYIVQGFWCDYIFTQYLSMNIGLNCVIIIVITIVSAVVLYRLSDGIRNSF